MPQIIDRLKGRTITMRSSDGQIRVSIPLVYRVRDDSGAASEFAIASTAGLPRVNEIVLIDGAPVPLACKEKVCQQDPKNNKEWTVSCACDNEPIKASTQQGTGEGESDSPDPTTWQVLWNIEYERAELVVETDRYGNPVRNFSNRPYSDPVVERTLVPTIKFTQYETANQSLRAIMRRDGALSEGEYLGGVPGGWQLAIEDSDKVYKNGVYCWRLDYKLRYHEKIVTNLLANALLWTLGNDGTIVAANTAGITATDDAGNQVVSGWLPIRPQLDYIDASGAAVVDTKDNQILGKIEVTGTAVAAASQGSAGINYLVHQTGKFLDFSSILRLQGTT